MEQPEPAALPMGGNGPVKAVLRWLVSELDAKAVALLQVAPGSRELLFVEPRGLDATMVMGLARRAREALVSMDAEEWVETDTVLSRWLGVGGSKMILLCGVSPISAAEPLRFARFAIEWACASAPGDAASKLEERVQRIPVVAWAEATDRVVRVLASEKADTASTRTAVEGEASGAGVAVEWLAGPSSLGSDRIRLLDVELAPDSDDRPLANVRLEWKGAELRGRAQGSTSLLGRYLAAARATVDALKPLIHGNISLEHVQISHTPNEIELVLVTVLIGSERFVGATIAGPGNEELAAARAVLDALNRRLTFVAGQSGRI